MKRTLLHSFIALLLACLVFPLYAQTALPYYTGFDNASQQAGWQAYKKGATGYFPWAVGAVGYSAPNMLSHDYPVGNPGTDTVVDWYVSPPFHFYGGGHLDSMKVKVYSIVGNATPQDEFGIYLLTGSPDPALADSIIHLADLTQMVSSSGTWEDTGGFVIPPYNGSSYIAFKYHATNNWFVPNIDNVNITGDTVNSVPQNRYAKDDYSVFPNPSAQTITIHMTDAVKHTVMIRDVYGKVVRSFDVKAINTSLDISSLATGRYFINIITDDKLLKTLNWVKE